MWGYRLFWEIERYVGEKNGVSWSSRLPLVGKLSTVVGRGETSYWVAVCCPAKSGIGVWGDDSD